MMGRYCKKFCSEPKPLLYRCKRVAMFGCSSPSSAGPVFLAAPLGKKTGLTGPPN